MVGEERQEWYYKLLENAQTDHTLPYNLHGVEDVTPHGSFVYANKSGRVWLRLQIRCEWAPKDLEANLLKMFDWLKNNTKSK